MRVKRACHCLTLKQGTFLAIMIDLIKITLTIVVLILELLEVSYYKDKNVDQFRPPEDVGNINHRRESIKEVEVKEQIALMSAYAFSLIRYMAVGLYGLLVLCKRFSPLHLGNYFWLKFLTSFLNILASLMLL